MKISIIIPVYNCEKYIEKLIQSILIQNYKNYEVIIINDGSTDLTKQILDKYKRRKKIKIINQKNNGVSNARNKGISLATGELMCFFDADDYIDKNYFQEIINYFAKNPDIELLNFGYFSELDKYIKVLNYKEIKYNTKNEILDEFVALWDSLLLYNVWNKVYLSKIIKRNKIRFSNIDFGEDIIFNRHYLEYVNCMYNSSKCFYHYSAQNEYSLTQKYRSDIFDITKKEFYEFNNYFQQCGLIKTEYYEFTCRRYIERIIKYVGSGKLNIKDRYKFIKTIINDKTTREALKYVKPKRLKTKIFIILIKYRFVLLIIIFSKFLNFVKTYNPNLFNRLKYGSILKN